MLKRFICGAFVVAALSGAGTAPVQAEELFVRNRPYKDVVFSGGTSYVTVDGFLNAVKVPWRLEGNTVVLGQGDSPDLSSSGESLSISNGGETLLLSGVVRNGRLYVPVKSIAEAAGYSVIYNQSTGVVDVVKSRLSNAEDAKIAQDIADTRLAEKQKRDEAWRAKVEKARADRQAKADAEKSKDDLDADDDEEEGDADSKKLDAKGNPDKDASDTKPAKLNTKADNDDLDSYDSADTTKADKKSDDSKDEKAAPPPKADLVVLSSDAEPNNYTGDVVFKAVLQNQGYATAGKVQARLVVVGPDGKQWLSKTYYHPDIKPDGRWEITENYHHRAASAIPRGEYDVKVVPTFESIPPKE